MKIKSIITLALIAFIFSPSLKGQQASTVGEIYDFEIGDIFHIEAEGHSPEGGYYSKSIIKIASKSYSSDSNTVNFVRSIEHGITSSDIPEWTYRSYLDTIHYSGLANLINGGDIDSVYSSNDFYNGRLINYHKSGWWKHKYVNGCGVAIEEFDNTDENFGEIKELVYFKKGNEIWGDSLILTINDKILTPAPDIKIYPNPATSILYIDFQDSGQLFDKLLIYSLKGKILLIRDMKSSSLTSIDISQLKKGMYILKLENERSCYQEKIIKK